MKKLAIITSVILGITSMALANTEPTINSAIKKYKEKNYVGCIQEAEDLIKKDPSNAVAHYYIGISYATIGNKEEAVNAYEKVISLSTNQTLVSYAKQGRTCLVEPDSCAGGETGTEIDKLLQSKEDLSEDTKKQIKKIRLEQLKHSINKDADLKSELPTNDEIAEAVKTLARAGVNPYNNITQNPYIQAQQAMYQNPEYMQLQMLMGNNNNNNNGNDFLGMLPFFFAQKQGNNNNNMSPDMIKNMMMSSMMGNISTTFDMDNKD